MKLLVLIGAFFISLTCAAATVPKGHPNKGSIDSAISLSELIKKNSDVLHSVSPAEHQYGTDEMAHTLLLIGQWAKEFGRQPVWVGDISKKNGGQLAHHKTHQRGLDADIAYLVYRHKPTGHRAQKLHDRFTEQFGMHGQLEENFDLESNYNLMARLMSEPTTFKIFVGCAIYDALESYDQKKSNSIMKNIYAEKGHEDHFHIRLKCPDEAANCSEQWWQDPEARPRRQKKKASKGVEKYRDC